MDFFEEYKEKLKEYEMVKKHNEEYEKQRHKEIKKLYRWAKFQVFLIKLRG